MEKISNLKITDTSYGGAGVGRNDDGRVIFVQKTVEGDIVDVEIIEDKKSYLQGRLLNIVSPSLKRITPQCALSEYCGGCSFSHIEYSAQLDIKKRIVKNVFRNYKHNNFHIDIIPSHQAGYRLRATCRSNNGKTGFYAYNSRELIYADNCPVIKPSLYEKMKKFAEENNLTGEIYAIENEENISLASVKIDKGNISKLDIFDGVMTGSNKHGISYAVFNTAYGAVPVTYKSFFQANRYLLDEFQKYAVSLVSKGMDIIELYAGAGFFTCGLSALGKTSACESDQIASNLGRQMGYNIKTEDSGRFLSKIKKCDTIFLDPPRIGADKKVIEQIKKIAPYEIIYVSCNPNTLARDIIRLENEYKVTDFIIFDMYPDTYHIESVVRLQREFK